MAESQCSWKAACIRTCHSGAIWFAVVKTRCQRSGTSGNAIVPSFAMRSMSVSDHHPSPRAIATKSSLTSGIMTPAWLRMKATAKSGSSPDEQPAMIEIVPVGATIVTLQLRSICIGRMRSPRSSRAHVSSGPQIERAHSGNGPRSCASCSLAFFDSTSRNSITRRPMSTPSAES